MKIKTITFAALATIISMVACNNSKSANTTTSNPTTSLTKVEKDSLEQKLMVHNYTTDGQHLSDSVLEAEKFKTPLIGRFSDAEVKKYTASHMDEWERKYNQPYNIAKDPNVTLDSYLKFCEAHNYQPMQYSKYIN